MISPTHTPGLRHCRGFLFLSLFPTFSYVICKAAAVNNASATDAKRLPLSPKMGDTHDARRCCLYAAARCHYDLTATYVFLASFAPPPDYFRRALPSHVRFSTAQMKMRPPQATRRCDACAMLASQFICLAWNRLPTLSPCHIFRVSCFGRCLPCLPAFADYQACFHRPRFTSRHAGARAMPLHDIGAPGHAAWRRGACRRFSARL